MLLTIHKRILKGKIDFLRADAALYEYRIATKVPKVPNVPSSSSNSTNLESAGSSNQNYLFLVLCNMKIHNKFVYNLFNSSYFKTVTFHWFALNLITDKSNKLDFILRYFCLANFLNSIFPILLIFYLILNFFLINFICI